MKEKKEVEECLYDLDSSKEVTSQSKTEELAVEKKNEKSKLELKLLPSHLK